MDRTVILIPQSGLEPMFLAYNIGHTFGDVVVPDFYGDLQRRIAKREEFENVYFDKGLAEILSPITFKGREENALVRYIESNIKRLEDVKAELKDHLRGFDAESVDGRIRRFGRPNIEINVGSMACYSPESGYYI